MRAIPGITRLGGGSAAAAGRRLRPFVSITTSLGVVGLLSLHSAVGNAQNAIANCCAINLSSTSSQLVMKIKQPFTVVAVGDMIQMTPVTQLDNPRIQYLTGIMRQADMTVANNENVLVDPTTFTGMCHVESPLGIAQDWVRMGIKMVNRANNLGPTCGDAGLRADFRILDHVGIVHAGAGPNMTDARLARYYTTPKGTVGMVGVWPIPAPSGVPTGAAVTVTHAELLELRAMRDSIVARRDEVTNPIRLPPPDPKGETTVWGLIFHLPGVKPVPPPTGDQVMDKAMQQFATRHRELPPLHWKLDTLRLTPYITVTAEQMAQLRGIAEKTGAKSVFDNNTLAVWGLHFIIGRRPGEYHYVMNQDDLREILRQVITGKQFSDFEIVYVHWHQNRYLFQHYSFDHYPADFETEFAHDVINEGADEFVGTGVHTIKGVEVYKGKPILYDVSNFFVQEMIVHSWRDFGGQPPVPPSGPIVGEGQVNYAQWAWMTHPANLQALEVQTCWNGAKLNQVRIYPVALGGPNRPWDMDGIPERPNPADANTILQDVARYSKPFGTHIDIQNGVGVIHVSSGGCQ